MAFQPIYAIKDRHGRGTLLPYKQGVDDGSTLTLDFTTGVLDPRLTFTRNGGGTYTGNNGLVYGMDFATSSSLGIGTGLKSVTLTATAGVDRRYLVGQTVWISNGANNMRGPVTAYNASTQVLTIDATGTSGSGSFTSWTVGNASARFDYDPTTGSPRGLLIEGAANNVCRRSEDFADGSWTADNSGAANPDVFTVSQTAPNGASSVNRVTLNKTGGTFSRLYQAITGTAGQTYTLSVWMKANTANGGAATQNVGLRIGGSNGINCVVTTTWQRFTHPAFAITGTDANFQLLLWDNIPANDETADVLVWGAQVETGSGASSYIPTGASTGNRAADVCYMANADYGFSTSGGTYLAEWHRGSIITTGSTGNNAFATDYASGRWLGIYTSGASSTGIAGSWSGYLNSSGAVSGINKMAVSYSSWVASASGNASLNGGAIVSGTLTLGTTPTYLFVGAASGTSPYSGGGYRDPLNNCVRRIKYWPSVLPNAQLQSLTT